MSRFLTVGVDGETRAVQPRAEQGCVSEVENGFKCQKDKPEETPRLPRVGKHGRR